MNQTVFRERACASAFTEYGLVHETTKDPLPWPQGSNAAVRVLSAEPRPLLQPYHVGVVEGRGSISGTKPRPLVKGGGAAVLPDLIGGTGP